MRKRLQSHSQQCTNEIYWHFIFSELRNIINKMTSLGFINLLSTLKAVRQALGLSEWVRASFSDANANMIIKMLKLCHVKYSAA